MLAGGGGRLPLRDQHRQRHDHRYSEEQGAARLLHAVGISATTDAGRIDIAAAPDGRQVFELNGLAGDLGVYAVAPDGALTLTATVHGLPAYDGSNGMEGTVAT
jgi:hypothetical protein